MNFIIDKSKAMRIVDETKEDCKAFCEKHYKIELRKTKLKQLCQED